MAIAYFHLLQSFGGVRILEYNYGAMIGKQTEEFLRSCPTFCTLDETVLKRFVSALLLRFFPAQEVLPLDEPGGGSVLYIVKYGSISAFCDKDSTSDKEPVYFSAGEVFDPSSIKCPNGHTPVFRANENTECFTCSDPEIIEELKRHFSDCPPPSAYGNMTKGEVLTLSHPFVQTASLLFTTPVRDIAHEQFPTATLDTPIADVVRAIDEAGTDGLLVVSSDGSPAGIITDADLRKHVLAGGVNPRAAASEIMNRSLLSIDSMELCFEALLKMSESKVNHLVVKRSGRVSAMVSSNDLLRLQCVTPMSLVREIESRKSIEELALIARKVFGLISLLIKQGTRASVLTNIITDINDRLERRVIRLSEKALGPPPVPYAWIIYGSEGRMEQMFKTDQDNAIIYEDPSDEGRAREAEQYFESLGRMTVEGLYKCGFAYCTGDYMASNPLWRKPLSAWRNYFSSWIETPTSDALIFSVILFDFRGLYGDMKLVDTLKDHLMNSLKGKSLFLKYLADMAVSVRPPLNFLGQLVPSGDADHEMSINIKNKCLAPLINAVRLFSLEAGVHETSTLRRIEELGIVHRTVKPYTEELKQAFELLSWLRIKHQFDNILSGAEPDNYISLNSLSNGERLGLRNACSLISRVLDSIAREYSQ